MTAFIPGAGVSKFQRIQFRKSWHRLVGHTSGSGTLCFFQEDAGHLARKIVAI
jgi:hypothetical protein